MAKEFAILPAIEGALIRGRWRGVVSREPTVFFSYARRNAKNAETVDTPYLSQFFDDLCKSIGDLLDLPSGEVGFIDERSIPPGEKWPAALSWGVQTCKVFVPLYSTSYFGSDNCDQEWSAFLSRCEAHAPREDAWRKLILPVFWLDEDDVLIPEPCRLVQYKHASLGSAYPQRGIKSLIMNSRWQADYQEFLRGFSKVVKTAIGEVKLPAHPEAFQFERLPKVFKSLASHGSGLPALPTSSRLVHFVFLAGSSDQVRAIRGDGIEAYGDEGHAWRPYYPDGDAVGPLAQGVAASQGLTSYPLDVTDDLIEQLKRRDRQVIVILVDPWTLRISRFEEIMRAYDVCHLLNCAVLIPWNLSDHATAAGRRS